MWPLGGSVAVPLKTPAFLSCAYWFSIKITDLMKCIVLCQDKHAVNIWMTQGLFMSPSLFCWGKSCCVGGQSSTGTTGIGLFTTRASPFPQAQNRHRGPVELWDECLCQRYDSVLNLVWMWSEPHRKKPFIPRSFLLSPGPICYPRFVADVVLCP